jgi:hypothetical protein
VAPCRSACLGLISRLAPSRNKCHFRDAQAQGAISRQPPIEGVASPSPPHTQHRKHRIPRGERHHDQQVSLSAQITVVICGLGRRRGICSAQLRRQLSRYVGLPAGATSGRRNGGVCSPLRRIGRTKTILKTVSTPGKRRSTANGSANVCQPRLNASLRRAAPRAHFCHRWGLLSSGLVQEVAHLSIHQLGLRQDQIVSRLGNELGLDVRGHLVQAT